MALMVNNKDGVGMQLYISMRKIRMRMRLSIGLITAMVIIAAPRSDFAREAVKPEDAVDCSIPKDVRKSRRDPEGTATEVKIGLFFMDIKSINDAKQTFSADIFFQMSWNDSRLSAESLGRSLKHCEIGLNNIWSPDLVGFVEHRGEKQLDDVVDIDNSGNVTYRQRFLNVEIYSDLNFQDFPFDTQILHVVIVTYEQEEGEISFVVDRESTGIQERLSQEGWDISLEEPIVTNQYLASQDRYLARVDFKLSAKRQTGYYLWKIILPLGFIVLMAWSVFWLDPSDSGPQIGVSTATVFTLVAYRFSLGFLLPLVSYFTRLDRFVLFSTVLVFLALAEAITTTKLAADGRKNLALKLDNWARVLFLVLFAMIIVFSFVL
jgi:hypothetical protein